MAAGAFRRFDVSIHRFERDESGRGAFRQLYSHRVGFPRICLLDGARDGRPASLGLTTAFFAYPNIGVDYDTFLPMGVYRIDGVRIENVLDTRYETAADFRMQSRSIFVELKYRWR